MNILLKLELRNAAELTDRDKRAAERVRFGAFVSLIHSEGMKSRDALRVFTEVILHRELKRCCGNQTLTARRLGIHRNTLARYLEKPRILEEAA